MPPTIRTCANAPTTTARLFVQLSMRRRGPAVLLLPIDLLLPGSSRRAVLPGCGARAYQITSSPPCPYIQRRQRIDATLWSSRLGRWAMKQQQQQQQQRRPLSFTATRRATTRAIYNPQVDEDGKEMMLEITPRAAKRLSQIMQKDNNPYLALRIQVESGGCHGFQYLMSLVTLPPTLPPPSSSPDSSSSAAAASSSSSEPTIREDDTIFTFHPETPETQSVSMEGKPKIILDQPSLDLLKGSKVDFTMELIGSQFKIVDNPLATSSCGCGTSFDIKI